MWALNSTWAYILPHFILVVRVRVSAAWKDMETIWQCETLLPFHSSLYNRSASWRWFSFRRQSFKSFNNTFFCFYSILIKCGLSKKAVTDCYNLQLHTSFPSESDFLNIIKILTGLLPALSSSLSILQQQPNCSGVLDVLYLHRVGLCALSSYRLYTVLSTITHWFLCTPGVIMSPWLLAWNASRLVSILFHPLSISLLYSQPVSACFL